MSKLYFQKRVTWLCVLTQILFPLMLLFTPVIVSGEEYPRESFLSQRTQVYILGEGETAATVAKKYNLTLDELQKINKFRTFSHGLNNIRPGDELDVPFKLEKSKKENTQITSGKSDGHDEQARRVSGYTSQTGSFLGNHPNSDAVSSLARGMATGVANSEIQRWLSRLGTARVQLDTDKNFSLKNSQLDLLVPLYDQNDHLIFTQGSLHRTDNREQINLGTGLRYFTPDYMVGGNLFGDYDLSRDHARMGVGAEYWRNFLKLSANSYVRLSEWRDSPILTDYEERPANGWDVRVQGWLPSLPQLGGKLAFEQYYGQEVALFGVDNHQKNPHTITAGINWTPIPLITLAAEQRQGQSGQSDTRFDISMRYQLGVPWGRQIDPAAVASIRSLAGSRYDLVERNNNIVLEYRKKNVIQLHTVELVTGYPAENKPLNVTVNSTYELSHIEWDAGTLITAGGKIVQSGADWIIELPDYQSSPQAVNTYTVYGVAVDIKGNRSERSEIQVTVLAPEVNKNYSTFTPVNSSLPADGQSTQVLTLMLKDAHNQPLDMNTAGISLKSNTLKAAKISKLTRKSPGEYIVTVTAGKEPETVAVTPLAQGVRIESAKVVINDEIPDAGNSQFSAVPESIPADNQTTTNLTLVAKDNQGKALSGLQNKLTFVVKDAEGKPITTDIITQSGITEGEPKGTYVALLKGKVPGTYKVIPEYNRIAIDGLSDKVTLTPSVPSPLHSSLETDRSVYTVGGTIGLTLRLKDDQDRPVTGLAAQLQKADINVPGSSPASRPAWTETVSGIYQASYPARTAVSTAQPATLNLDALSLTSQPYTVAPRPPAQANSSLKTDRSVYTVGGTIVLTLRLKDDQDRPVTGLAAQLQKADINVPGSSPASRPAWTETVSGIYQASYPARTAVSTAQPATLKLDTLNLTSLPYTIKVLLQVTLADKVQEMPVGGAFFTFKAKVSPGIKSVRWSITPWTTNIGMRDGYALEEITDGGETVVKDGIALLNVYAHSNPAGPLTVSGSADDATSEADKTISFTQTTAKFVNLTVNGKRKSFNELTTAIAGGIIQLNVNTTHPNDFKIQISNAIGGQDWAQIDSGNKLEFLNAPSSSNGEIILTLVNKSSGIIADKATINIRNWIFVTPQLISVKDTPEYCKKTDSRMTMANVSALKGFYQQWGGERWEWSEEVFASSDKSGDRYIAVKMSDGSTENVDPDYNALQVCNITLR